MSPPPRSIIIDSLAASLAAVLHVEVFDGFATDTVPGPDGAGWIIIHSIAGGGFIPTLADDTHVGRYTYQFDAMSPNRQQAEWLRDALNNALLDRASNGDYAMPVAAQSGFVQNFRELLNPGPVDRTGIPPNQMYVAVTRLILHVSPA